MIFLSYVLKCVPNLFHRNSFPNAIFFPIIIQKLACFEKRSAGRRKKTTVNLDVLVTSSRLFQKQRKFGAKAKLLASSFSLSFSPTLLFFFILAVAMFSGRRDAASFACFTLIAPLIAVAESFENALIDPSSTFCLRGGGGGGGGL